ncbi:MAG TPA: glycosyltransferase [Candidatus Dormibacteraeota bacterium]|nr:glycosyltransferase [Candidatus Dormibacteraeota bacterium]
MKRIHVLFHDSGGGHRNAAVALETVARQQQRPWQVELIQFQDLADQMDVLRKLTGIRIQEQYNVLLRNGWTLGITQLLRVLQVTIRLFHRPMVRLLTKYFRKHPADLLVSVIPHFNRQIAEAWSSVYPERPFVTLITDLADFPPRFWIEPLEQQYVICGTQRAVEQARAMGKRESQIFATSGMILRPDFYLPDGTDPLALRRELGLQPDLPTGILLFGGFGSKVMFDIVERLDVARVPVQLIVICGRNDKLAEEFRARSWNLPLHVLGFTKEVHRLMRAADFLIGKPGPGSVAEAMVRRLPVILECNAWTMPQERYNTQWVKEKRVGIILSSFDEIVPGVQQLLEPATFAEFRRNVAALDNQAIFEIPEILAGLLGEPARSLTQNP